MNSSILYASAILLFTFLGFLIAILGSISFKKIKRKSILIFIFLISLAAFFRIQQPLSHAIYMDEENFFLYEANLTNEKFLSNFCFLQPQNLDCSIKLANNKVGYSFINSLIFAFSGFNETLAFITNITFGLLSVGLVFLITRALFGERAAFFSAAFLALLPEHIRWSVTTSSEVSALTFFLTSVYMFILYLKSKKPNFLLASLAAAGFVSTIRPELAFLFALESIFIIQSLKELWNYSCKYFLILLIFMLLVFAYLFVVINSIYLSLTYWNKIWPVVYETTQFYSAANIITNIQSLFLHSFVIRNLLFFVLVIAFIVGLIHSKTKPVVLKRFYLAVLFIIFLMYASFFLGEYKGIALVHSRYPMLWLSFLTIISGGGFVVILKRLNIDKHIIFALVILIFSLYLQLRFEALIPQGDTWRSKERKTILALESLNPSCTFITTDAPGRENLHGYKGISMDKFMFQGYLPDDCYIFLEPNICKVAGYKKMCEEMIVNYSWNLVYANNYLKAWSIEGNTYKVIEPKNINYEHYSLFDLISRQIKKI